jgi:hypothetical protein
VTFASPHLGVRTPLRGWHNHIWNVLGARTLSASGRQLFTIDNFRDTGRPLLEILADPESIFIKGLAKFERRTLYTNIVNDRSTVYYTTGISRIDPYTNPDKTKITYLKGYDDVIVDPSAPVVPLEELPRSTFFERMRMQIGRLPFVLAMILLIPLGVTIFLISSAFQSLRSNQRIRLYEKGLTSIRPDMYRVPLLINNMREAVEDVYENINNAQSHEYLVDESEEKESGASQESPKKIPSVDSVDGTPVCQQAESIRSKHRGTYKIILTLLTLSRRCLLMMFQFWHLPHISSA